MITTTLNRVLAACVSQPIWDALLAGLDKAEADDEPLPFARIAEILGLDGALHLGGAAPSHARKWRLFAAWCAHQVVHHAANAQSSTALDVAAAYARGEVTAEEFAAAGKVARAAARAGRGARDDWDAARWAHKAVRSVFETSSGYAAKQAARAAAHASAMAALEAGRRSRSNAKFDAAWAVARAAQTRVFISLVSGDETCCRFDLADVGLVTPIERVDEPAAPLSWPQWLAQMARTAATKSKDTTKVGALLVGDGKFVHLTAFNGPPAGVEDRPDRLLRPAKYLFSSHAEANLVAFAARKGIRTDGCSVWVTHAPCAGCARTLIQAGVSAVRFGPGTTSMPAEEFEAARTMFREAKVVCEPWED